MTSIAGKSLVTLAYSIDTLSILVAIILASANGAVLTRERKLTVGACFAVAGTGRGVAGAVR